METYPGTSTSRWQQLNKSWSLLGFMLMFGLVGSVWLLISHAATPTGDCGGSDGSRTYGSTSHAIYYCHFWETSPIYDVNTDAKTSHTFSAGSNWVMCQVKGSTVSSGGVANYWWAFTESNQSTWGWVNAYYAEGGTNYEQFNNVPVGCPSAFGLAPGEPKPPSPPAPTPTPTPHPTPTPTPTPHPTPTPTPTPTPHPTPTPTPTPHPTPTPTPTPGPAPHPNPTPTPNPNPPGTTVTPTSPKPSVSVPSKTGATVSDAANAVVATGTTSATLTIPAGNATNIHVAYGISASALTTQTDDQSVSGDSVTVVLQDLTPKTTYTYLIGRTGSLGAASTSANASFTTSGYGITLQFVDKNNNDVPGITGSINDGNDTQATSDGNGNMNFLDLVDGDYTISYTYQDKPYSQELNTSSDDVISGTDPGQTIVLGETINVDELLTNPAGAVHKTVVKKKSSSSASGLVFTIFLTLCIVGGITWFLLRRRRNLDSPYAVYPSAPLPTSMPTTTVAEEKPHHVRHHKTEAPQTADHMGESLRDMVIKSMHEEATRRKQPPQDPPPTA